MAHLAMDRRVRAALRRLAPEARRVLVAVSGGSDSVALLRALTGDARLAVVAAHLDHGLRPASSEDAAWVEATCRDLGVPCRREAAPVGEIAGREGRNVEEVGRTLRYAFLTRVAREHGCDVVATAHTRNDQAETVLLQLLRGSAHPSGIAPRQGRIVRPLLELSKADLRGWLDGLGQAWREDASNRDLARDRAWLRHQVLPRLEARRAGAGARLARFGHLQREQAAFLADEARRRFGTGPLARGALAAAPVALRREALVQLVRSAGGEADRVHLDALVAALDAGVVTRRDLPGGVRVRLLPDRVDVVASGPPPPADGEGVAVRRPEELPRGLPAALLERGTWRLRAPRAGDRIRTAGGERKVADVLSDAKVPREERGELRVLASDGEVVWIEGVAVAAGLDEAAADPDRPWMRRALALADEAAAAGELPVGAVVVRDGAVLGEGRNRREADGDPTAHAELVAMRSAAEADGDWRLAGATLYVTLEPCPMCAGAVLASQLERVVWGAANRRDGAFGSVVDLSAGPWKRLPRRRAGVLAREAAHRLERFFAARRAEGAPPAGGRGHGWPHADGPGE
jgi:tRNA(Ile)-lysidine synthase